MHQRSKCKNYTVKLLDKDIKQKLQNTEFNNDILDMTPKAQETKEKTDKLGSIKIRIFCVLRATINGVKRQPRVGKVFVNHTPDKGLTSRIY